MRMVERVAEAMMIAAFLKAEINSPRWKQCILEQLARDGVSRSLVDTPDLKDDRENALRTKLLGFRGYNQDTYLFAGFPDDVEWQRAVLAVADLRKVAVINQVPWIEFSGRSRLAWEAARNLASGQVVHAVRDDIDGALKQLARGIPFPEIILVGRPLGETLVVLEGHVRLMALLTLGDEIETTAIVGTSPNISKWQYF